MLEGQQLAYRADLCRFLLPDSIAVELGVAEGHFSEEILKSKNISHLYSIDMYAGDRGHDVGQYKQAFRRLSQFRGRTTLLKMRFDEALDLFDDESIDLLYVDGYAHTGEEGGKTFLDWYPKVKRGAIIAGHDFGPDFPLVVQAVQRFCSLARLELHVINDRSGGSNHSQPTWFAVKPAG